jgi:hypothetical protein
MVFGFSLRTAWTVILAVSVLLDMGCPALPASRGARERPLRDSRATACEKTAILQPGIRARRWRVA